MQHSRGRGLLEYPRKPRPPMNRRRVEREFYFPGRGQLHRLAAIYMNTCPLSTPLYNTESSREICPSEPTIFHLIGHGRKDLGLQPQVRNSFKCEILKPALVGTVKQGYFSFVCLFVFKENSII